MKFLRQLFPYNFQCQTAMLPQRDGIFFCQYFWPLFKPWTAGQTARFSCLRTAHLLLYQLYKYLSCNCILRILWKWHDHFSHKTTSSLSQRKISKYLVSVENIVTNGSYSSYSSTLFHNTNCGIKPFYTLFIKMHFLRVKIVRMFYRF